MGYVNEAGNMSSYAFMVGVCYFLYSLIYNHSMFEGIIIGGGILGLLTALELAKAGCRITLLERNTLAGESSWAGGGILSPLYPWRYPLAVNALAAWSQQHYSEFCESLAEETGVDPEYTPSGMLILDSGEIKQAENWAARQQHTLEILEPEGIAQCEPRLGEHPDNGLWLPRVAQVRNPRLTRALIEAARAAQVTVREHSPVKHLLLENGRAVGVCTETDEKLRGDGVIVAAGAWSGELTRDLAIDLPVKPIRGQMLLFKASPGLVTRIVLRDNRYVIPRRDGRVLVGSTLEDMGFDKAITREARSELQQTALRLIPALKDAPVEKHWAGLRPGSPRGIPCISACSQVPGLYFNTGHFRNGVVLGLASARLLTDIILNREPILPPRDYVSSMMGENDWPEMLNTPK